MRISQITLSPISFAKLPESEQLFFLRLAQAHDDLRCLYQLAIRASNGLEKTENKIEKNVILHEFMFAVLGWYGTAFEAWRIIARDWYDLGPRPWWRLPIRQLIRFMWRQRPQRPSFGDRAIANQFAGKLDSKGQAAADALLEYFTRPNLVKRIRNRFSFHYDARVIKRQLPVLREETSHYFITGEQSGNLFYSFAEKIRYYAMAREANKTDVGQGPKTLYKELTTVWGWIDDFTRFVLPLIAEKCEMQRTTFESEAVTDMSSVRPIVFVDEKTFPRAD